jgi:hypothetical protein
MRDAIGGLIQLSIGERVMAGFDGQPVRIPFDLFLKLPYFALL